MFLRSRLHHGIHGLVFGTRVVGRSFPPIFFLPALPLLLALFSDFTSSVCSALQALPALRPWSASAVLSVYARPPVVCLSCPSVCICVRVGRQLEIENRHTYRQVHFASTIIRGASILYAYPSRVKLLFERINYFDLPLNPTNINAF